MPKKLSQKQIIIIITGVVLAGGLYWLVFGGGGRKVKPPPVELSVWGPLQERSAMQALFDAYDAVPGYPRSNVKFLYEYIPETEYHDRLLNALAAGLGPDLFLVKNTWIPAEASKLAYAPVAIENNPYNLRALSYAAFRNAYPQVVEHDFVYEGFVYAVPLYMDTLAMIYNIDVFDRALIAETPRTWRDVEAVVPFLRETNESGQLTRAAAAIGGSGYSMRNVRDVVSLLILQNGGELPISAAQPKLVFSNSYAAAAFNFYLQFANAASKAYAWNDEQPRSSDSVASGRTAMAFGYQSEYAALRNKNPFANVRVAPMPQVEGAREPVNYASYWGLAVSRQSPNWQWGWDVAASLMEPSVARAYAMASGRLPALRSLIPQYYTDPNLGPFAQQALTARSWYQVNDERYADVFDQNVRSVLLGQADSRTALLRIAEQINKLIQ